MVELMGVDLLIEKRAHLPHPIPRSSQRATAPDLSHGYVLEIAEYTAGFENSADHAENLTNVLDIENSERQPGDDIVVAIGSRQRLDRLANDLDPPRPHGWCKRLVADDVAAKDFYKGRLELADVQGVSVSQNRAQIPGDGACACAHLQDRRRFGIIPVVTTERLSENPRTRGDRAHNVGGPDVTPYESKMVGDLQALDPVAWKRDNNRVGAHPAGKSPVRSAHSILS